jgi:hemerythrin-like domain-containing protein
VTVIGANETVITILTRDHGEMERIFAELQLSRGATGRGVRERRRELVDEVTVDLVRHSVGEEAEVYPRIKERVSAAGAERLVQQHAEAERTMKRLEGMSIDNPAFEGLLALLIDQVRTHVAEEETEMLPALRRMFSEPELIELGAKLEAVKRIAPLRPHPLAPDGPPADILIAPIASLFDRLRHALSHRTAIH